MENYLIYIILGILPSIIWLLFYLRKDINPEPKRKILKVFCGGAIAALMAAVIETLILKKILDFNIGHGIAQAIYIFLGIALVEEYLKYFVVKKKVFMDSEFDEPVDAIVYMITSALGFAALENTLLFFSEKLHPLETFLVSTLRFGGATFLHALCSGVFGFFIALSFFKKKKRQTLFLIGFLTAIILHGLYNFSIMKIEGSFKFAIPILILLSLAFCLPFCFRKLKKIKSVCETKLNR